MESLLQDLRFGLRRLLKRPGFTVAVLSILALGIGANTAMFSVVDAVVLRSLPYASPDQLMVLWEESPANGLYHQQLSPVNFVDYRSLHQVFTDAAVWWRPQLNLTDTSGEPIRVESVETSGNLFSVLGVQPLLGSGFTNPDRLQSNEPEAVISHNLWKRRYGGDPAILGKSIKLDGRPYSVVGIMPPGFQFPAKTEVWQRLTWDPAFHSRRAHFMEAVARLAPGISLQRAQIESTDLAARLAAEYPEGNQGRTVRLVPLSREVQGIFRPALLVLLGAVGLLLLIACINVANLLLVNASTRQAEVAIRAAIGGGRWRLIRQLLTENLLLAFLGALLGLALAYAVLRFAVVANPLDIPGIEQATLNGRVLAFMGTITVLTALLFGLAPAFKASRTDLIAAVSGQGARGRSGRRLRNSLIVLEVALAFMLSVGAGLLLRSFVRLLAERPGFDAHGLVAADIQLPLSTYAKANSMAQFYSRLLDNLRAYSRVKAADASGFLPMEANWRTSYDVKNQPTPAGAELPKAQFQSVSEDYFRTMGVPLLAGRLFKTGDDVSASGVVVINEKLARRHWPNQDPVGQVLTVTVHGLGTLGAFLLPKQELTIIGVVDDVKNNTLMNDVEPALYFSYRQFPIRNMYLVVRGDGNQREIAKILQDELKHLDPTLALAKVRSLEDFLDDALVRPRFLMVLMGGFAILALLLAGTGVYSVLSYAVSQQRREIGIRIALGARPRSLQRLVVGRGMILVLIGAFLGVLGALALGRFATSLLFGISSYDGLTFAGVFAVVLFSALIACYLPARRAASTDPMVALRLE